MKPNSSLETITWLSRMPHGVTWRRVENVSGCAATAHSDKCLRSPEAGLGELGKGKATSARAVEHHESDGPGRSASYPAKLRLSVQEPPSFEDDAVNGRFQIT